MVNNAIQGTRFHIAGSAAESADLEIIKGSHIFVKTIVKRLLSLGGGLTITVAGENYLDDKISTIFDWSIVGAIVDSLRQKSISWSRTDRKAISIIVYSDFDKKMPEENREMWKELLQSEFVELRKRLAPRESVGEALRKEQAIDGDLLITLGGQKGVYRLAKLYQEQKKSVIPLDLDLGYKTSNELSQEAKNHPELFFICKNSARINLLYNALPLDLHSIQNNFVDQLVYLLTELIEDQSSNCDKYETIILHELIQSVAQLQLKQQILRKAENNYTGFLVEILNSALSIYSLHADEQKPGGESPNAKSVKGETGGLGELDFLILDVPKREIITMCEAILINNFEKDKSKFQPHLHKLFGYDLIGLPYNFCLCYVKDDRFDDVWDYYLQIVPTISYKYPLKNRSLNQDLEIGKRYFGIKLATTLHLRNGEYCKLYHVFIQLIK